MAGIEKRRYGLALVWLVVGLLGGGFDGVRGAWAACANLSSVAGDGMVVSFVDARIARASALDTVEGQMVYDATDKVLKICSGGEWVKIISDAVIEKSLNVGGAVHTQDGFSTPFTRMGFYSYSSTGNTAGLRWLHLKTNQTINTRMQTIEFKGYDYRGTKPINARLSYYAYTGNNDVYAVGGSGSHNVTAYKSADGYVVIALQAHEYFIGFVLNQYGAHPHGFFPVEIVDTRWSTAGTGAY